MSDNGNWKPRIVGCFCNWCTYTGADLAGISRMSYEPNTRVIRLMCSGRLDPQFVMKAFREGADAVLIGGCHPGDCHYTSGNLKLRARWALMKKALEQAGIDPRRVRLQWASAAEAQAFADGVRILVEQVRELGPIRREWK